MDKTIPKSKTTKTQLLTATTDINTANPGYLYPTDNKQLEHPLLKYVDNLPFKVSDQWRPAVVGHMQFFGKERVIGWAHIASTKRMPERYFMRILSKQRYGK